MLSIYMRHIFYMVLNTYLYISFNKIACNLIRLVTTGGFGFFFTVYKKKRKDMSIICFIECRNNRFLIKSCKKYISPVSSPLFEFPSASKWHNSKNSWAFFSGKMLFLQISLHISFWIWSLSALSAWNNTCRVVNLTYI